MDKKNHRCTFEGCNAAFDRPFRLTQHRLAHEDLRLFQCTKCPKSYTTKSHLNRHENTAHLKIKAVIYSCPVCIQVCANRQNLKRHILRNHTDGVKSCWCDYCKKGFKTLNHLKSHMYEHTKVKAFRCNLCQKEFIREYERRKHMKQHRTYSCTECDKQFGKYEELLKHKVEHEPNEFWCDICNRSFKERSDIVRHLKRHSQNQTQHFPCPHENCGRVYTTKYNLSQHILIRHEHKTYDCHICETQLSSKAKLQNHLKIIHNKVPTKDVPKPMKPRENRKIRKDRGVLKKSIALELAGLNQQANHIICS